MSFCVFRLTLLKHAEERFSPAVSENALVSKRDICPKGPKSLKIFWLLRFGPVLANGGLQQPPGNHGLTTVRGCDAEFSQKFIHRDSIAARGFSIETFCDF